MSQPRERCQGTSTRQICPSIRAGVGTLAEGEPFRLPFSSAGGGLIMGGGGADLA